MRGINFWARKVFLKTPKMSGTLRENIKVFLNLKDKQMARNTLK